jgi:hypothetical protein
VAPDEGLEEDVTPGLRDGDADEARGEVPEASGVVRVPAVRPETIPGPKPRSTRNPASSFSSSA